MPDISIPLLVGLYLCALGSGIVSQTILSFVILLLVVLLFFTDRFYYVLPIMIFYYSVFGVVFGVSIFRIYTILVLIRFLLKDHKITLKPALLPAIVYILYCIIVFSSYSVRRSIFTIISILCVLVILDSISYDEDKTKTFFKLYVIAALCSFFTGLIQGNSLEYSEMMVGGYSEMNRFMATFEDPNYMGFFFTIAIFAMVTLELFPKVIRIIFTIALSIMILTSLSMTAVVGNLLIWILYLLFGRKINIKTGIILFAIIFTVVALLNSGVLNSIPFIKTLMGRIQYKILEWEGGNTYAVTSGRTTHWEEHLQYFNSQPIIKQLFGGNFSTPYGVDLQGLGVGVAHNEYIDELLNVGIIGEIIIVGQIIYDTGHCIKQHILSKNALDFSKIIFKFIWLYYAFTLTVFLDYRFMIAYFI